MKIRHLFIVFCFLYNAGSQAQSLQDYLIIAKKNSPELQSQQYRHESALEKINEVGSVSNTTFGVGYFVQEAETRVGAQKTKLSVSQMLPWFGTLEAKKESESFKADAQLNSIDLTKRKLFLDVKTAYFELYELKEKEIVLNRNIDILNTFEKLALNELENNRSTMVDILKIQIEQNEVANNRKTVFENLNAKKRAFNLLLNRNEEVSIKVTDSILVMNKFEFFDKDLINQNPKLLELDNLQISLLKSELAIKKEGLPKIGLGLDYVFIENRAVDNLLDNGKDIIMPMVSVSVPLFSKKYSSKQKQLQLEQKAIETIRAETTNQLNSVYEIALANLKNAERAIKTQTDNLTQAEQAERVLLASYQTSKLDFEQILEIQQLKLKFQLNRITAEKQYAIQQAVIEFLTSDN
jgi:outer membrane protein TolC